MPAGVKAAASSIQGDEFATRERNEPGKVKITFAVRILLSAHTNPVFIQVGDTPIGACRRSAEWCRKAVDICWNSKKGNIRVEEQEEAKSAYDRASRNYEEILKASVAD